jgi:Nitroreductase
VTCRDAPSGYARRMTDPLPFDAAVVRRHAARHFTDEPVSQARLARLLALTRRAPSGYDSQPWCAVVVRDPVRKRQLQRACLGQAQVVEAPAVVVFAANARPVSRMREIATQNQALGAWSPEYARFMRRYTALRLGARWLDPVKRLGTWLIGWIRSAPYMPFGARERRAYAVKQTMLAGQTFMLAAAAHGLDTCPMEGLDPWRVRRVVGLGRPWWVPLVVPVGVAAERPAVPSGRVPASTQVFDETAGRPFAGVAAADAALLGRHAR